MSRKPFLFESREDCYGCSACFSVCPRGAIKMVEDAEGFDYPEIDDSLCIECLKCEKVCIIKNK